ncbi:MAG: methyltransferase domain-containing protein [Candidatus Krumholzibacteria bacterium]|nr:methyltransferase domain-containing protein [Candidatus Krumholzibacteria bacterium]
MESAVPLETFLAASPYTDPVDRKKLRFIHRALTAYARRQGRTCADLSVLELGCGVGAVTLALASLGARVVGVDVDAGDLAALRDDAQTRGLANVEAREADALVLDLGARFDVVIASEVFEHVREPQRLAEAAARHCRDGGLLVVTTPNGYGPWETVNSLKLAPRRWRWLRRILGKPAHDGRGREHEQRYTRGRLASMLAAHGFALEEAANSDFVFTVARALRRSPLWGTLDCWLADRVPHGMASGWYLALVHRAAGPPDRG